MLAAAAVAAALLEEEGDAGEEEGGEADEEGGAPEDVAGAAFRAAIDAPFIQGLVQGLVLIAEQEPRVGRVLLRNLQADAADRAGQVPRRSGDVAIGQEGGDAVVLQDRASNLRFGKAVVDLDGYQRSDGLIFPMVLEAVGAP